MLKRDVGTENEWIKEQGKAWWLSPHQPPSRPVLQLSPPPRPPPHACAQHSPSPLQPRPSGRPVSSQLGRRGGPGWRGAPWVVSLVTVAKAAALRRCWELEVFGAGSLRGQGSVESPGGDGEADDPDFRQGEAHCPEAATRGTGPSSEGAGAAGPPRPGEGRHARRLGPGEGFTCRPEASIL